jgi:hypothetical protein
MRLDSRGCGAQNGCSLVVRRKDLTVSNEEFAHRLNVKNFTRQLAAAPNGPKRKQLMALLAEERARAVAAGWMPTFD